MKKTLLTLLFVSFFIATAQNPIQEFDFNGTLNNTANNISFTGSANFVSDRMGVVKSAQRLVNKGMEAVIDNLPQDNNARSVSVWVKFNAISSPNYIWGYGNAVNGQYCGLLQQGTSTANSDLSLAGWGTSNDIIVSTPLARDIWYQYTITHDGKSSKIYRNGELLKSISGISRQTKGNIFRLGEINTTVGINADIDDLKIYNVALTDSQVLHYYNDSKPVSESLSVANTETKTTKNTLVTKPVNTAKNVEVFSQGRKIVGSNASNIGDLPEGTYLLKITNKTSKK